jgi:hypothetical protein
MAGVTNDMTMPELKSDDLNRHRIIRVHKRQQAYRAAYLLNISDIGRMAEYRVPVGEFRIYIKVLNLNFNMVKMG